MLVSFRLLILIGHLCVIGVWCSKAQRTNTTKTHSIVNTIRRTYVFNWGINAHLISITESGEASFGSDFCWCFIIYMLMQQKFRCINLIGVGWGTWKTKQITPTYLSIRQKTAERNYIRPLNYFPSLSLKWEMCVILHVLVAELAVGQILGFLLIRALVTGPPGHELEEWERGRGAVGSINLFDEFFEFGQHDLPPLHQNQNSRHTRHRQP